VTEGKPGHRNGLFVLRQQGFAAWIVLARTQLESRPQDELPLRAKGASKAVLVPSATTLEAPLVGLCADMLLRKIQSPNRKELQ
jgi:hypothetical protein